MLVPQAMLDLDRQLLDRLSQDKGDLLEDTELLGVLAGERVCRAVFGPM